MKKSEIRAIYTAKVTELLNQGYTIYPDSMSGSQGEIAHIDLTDGSEIVRVLLESGMEFNHDGYTGDVIRLRVGAAPAVDVESSGYSWHHTIWNNRLEPRFEIVWAELSSGTRRWYVSMEEGARACKTRRERFNAVGVEPVPVEGALKSVCVRWLRKQPRMKTVKPADVTVRRVLREDGSRRYEIRARGERHILFGRLPAAQ